MLLSSSCLKSPPPPKHAGPAQSLLEASLSVTTDSCSVYGFRDTDVIILATYYLRASLISAEWWQLGIWGFITSTPKPFLNLPPLPHPEIGLSWHSHCFQYCCLPGTWGLPTISIQLVSFSSATQDANPRNNLTTCNQVGGALSSLQILRTFGSFSRHDIAGFLHPDAPPDWAAVLESRAVSHSPPIRDWAKSLA